MSPMGGAPCAAPRASACAARRSVSACAKYQHVEENWKSAAESFFAASRARIQLCVGFMFPARPDNRMLLYFPARMALRVSLRLNVCSTGSAMFDWPPQYHTSPNVAFAIDALPLHPASQATLIS